MATTVTFIVAPEIAEGASTGVVLGEFNNWNLDNGFSLERQQDGSLRAIANLEPGRTYQYRYLLSDGRWVNDGRAQSYVPASGFFVDNCVITVPEEEAVTVVEETFIPASTIEPGSTEAAEPVVKTKTKKSGAGKAAAKKKAAKSEAPADDLGMISGVNKKAIALLAEEGINSYKTLSKATGKKLKAILDAGGDKFSKIDPLSWPKQAKLAAAGEWEELEQLQQQLKSK